MFELSAPSAHFSAAALRFAAFPFPPMRAISLRRSGLNFFFRNFASVCAAAFFRLAMMGLYHVKFCLRKQKTCDNLTFVSAFDITPRPIYNPVKPARDEKFKAFVRKLCCVVCGSYRLVEAAHFGPHGIGQKSCDYTCLPLCLRCHRTGPKSYHTLGARRFVEVHRLNVATHQAKVLKFYREKIAA